MNRFQHAKWWMAATAACSMGAYFTGSALAQGIPLQEPLVYSGQLSDADGTASNGSFDIDIVLWGSATGDSSDERLCETTDQGVNVEAGFFRLVLDQGCLGAVSDNSNVWVEVRVDGESLGRTKIASVPYAVTANQAVSAAEGGELAQQLASLQEQLDAYGDRLDDHETRLDDHGPRLDEQEVRLGGFDSGWLEMNWNESIEVPHDLGVVPTHVSVVVEDPNGNVHVSGSAWNNREGEGRRGVIVTHLTHETLMLRSGAYDQTGLYDSGGTGGPIAQTRTGRVRVRAWR